MMAHVVKGDRVLCPNIGGTFAICAGCCVGCGADLNPNPISRKDAYAL